MLAVLKLCIDEPDVRFGESGLKSKTRLCGLDADALDDVGLAGGSAAYGCLEPVVTGLDAELKGDGVGRGEPLAALPFPLLIDLLRTTSSGELP